MDPQQATQQEHLVSSTPRHSGLSRIVIPTLSLLTLLLLLSTGLLGYQNMQLQKQIAQLTKPVLTPTPTPVSDPMANWKTYTFDDWGVSIKSPFNPTQGNILFVGTYISYNRSKLTTCPKEVSTSLVSNCIISKNWGLPEDFQITTLGNKTAISFFMFEPKTNTIVHVVQTTTRPLGEIAMKVDGAGLEKQFQQILSTFKFIEPTHEDFCGGIAGIACPTGFSCKLDDTYPDAGGTCVQTPRVMPTTTSYTCPINGWQNCMPMLSDEGKKACSDEAFAWYKKNCPNFQGGAY